MITELENGTNTQSSPMKERRLPETAFLSWHLARTLHESLSCGIAVNAGAKFRAAVSTDDKLNGLPASAKNGLLRAAASTEDVAARTGLLQLCRIPNFGKLGPAVQKSLLKMIEEQAAAPALVKDLAAAVQMDAFVQLSERAQMAMIAELGRHGAAPLVRRALTSMLAVAGFLALQPSEQCDLLHYLSGPKLAEGVAPMRKNRFELCWNTRRSELSRVLRGPSFLRGSALEQAEALRDFMHEPALKVCFLNATEVNGHAVVVFGDPSDPRSLSYGRRWVVTSNKKPAAKIYSPDPTVQSGWKKPEMDAHTRYAYKAMNVSRFVEWQLLTWIEQSHVVHEDHRVQGLGVGPATSSRQAGSFCDSAFTVLLSFVAKNPRVDVKSGYMRAGKPVDSSAETNPGTKATDELLAKFLAA